MKIESVKVANFRSFGPAPQEVRLGPYTSLVGPNGSGKSNLLQALNLFFRKGPQGEWASIGEDDFYHRDTSRPATVEVTFTELPDEAQQEFRHYYRQGKLIVTAEAVYDAEAGRAEIQQFGSRMAMPEFGGYFKALGEGAKVSELRTTYAKIKLAFPGLPAAGPEKAMTEALRAYEESNPSRCKPARSADQFYGFTKGANRLQKYIEWVYIPAVKDASGEQQEARATAFGELLARAVRSRVDFGAQVEAIRERARAEYRLLLDAKNSELSALSASLKQRLRSWSHPGTELDIKWLEDERAVRVEPPVARALTGEANFLGEVGRQGHGVQRCYLLALLQELAGCDSPAGPTLVLACEEPELYQHPPQARHMAETFRRLSAASQVILSTHSTHFVAADELGALRMVRRSGSAGPSEVWRADPDGVAKEMGEARGEEPRRPAAVLAKLHSVVCPEVAEMFFARALVLVEGQEDRAYIAAYLHLDGLWEKYRAIGCHIVPTEGKNNMAYLLAVANSLRLPAMGVFDADGAATGKERVKQERENLALRRLLALGDGPPFPQKPLISGRACVWPLTIAETFSSEMDAEVLAAARAEALEGVGSPRNPEKNALFVAALANASWDRGGRCGSLLRLCRHIASGVWLPPEGQGAAAPAAVGGAP